MLVLEQRRRPQHAQERLAAPAGERLGLLELGLQSDGISIKYMS